MQLSKNICAISRKIRKKKKKKRTCNIKCALRIKARSCLNISTVYTQQSTVFHAGNTLPMQLLVISKMLQYEIERSMALL